jgi:hypothetical protein
VVSGSTARGLADVWSDLELAVYWDQPPADALRDRAIAALGAALTRRVSFEAPDGWFGVDNLEVDGFGVDVPMTTCARVERILDAVLGGDLAEDKHELVAILSEVEPVSGHERVRAWQERAVIGDDLQRALVAHHLRLLPSSAMYVDLARGNDVRVLERTLSWVQDGLRALFAINRVWFPGFKAARLRLPTLRLQPADTPARLAAALRGPTREAAEAAVAWLDDVYRLAVDIAEVQASWDRFRAPGRRAWAAEEVAAVATEIREGPRRRG